MKEVMGILDRDTVAKAYRRLRSRIEAVVAVNGDFLNRMLDDNHGFHIFFKLIKSDHF
jgi:hypothetical protein